MKIRELNRLDLFYVIEPSRKGVISNTVYQLVEHQDTGVIARGVLQTNFGDMDLDFYLPDFTEVDLIPSEEIF